MNIDDILQALSHLILNDKYFSIDIHVERGEDGSVSQKLEAILPVITFRPWTKNGM